MHGYDGRRSTTRGILQVQGVDGVRVWSCDSWGMASPSVREDVDREAVMDASAGEEREEARKEGILLRNRRLSLSIDDTREERRLS